ncbi:MAG: hypothetical protein JWO68_1967, partial [Actinomycetia bacterium]|nr:hypothetical protein [Actinomycetes bacterium]
AEEVLGGAVEVARRAPHRDDIGAITDWLGRELDRLGVDVRLKTPVDRALVDELGPDVVVVATGAVESRAGRQVARGADPVPGADRPHVWTAGEAHRGDLPEVGTAVVLDEDGRYAAVGAAERLAVAGLSVAVVSRFSEVASRLAATQEQGPAVARLAALGVVFLGHTVLDDIDEDVVTVRSLADGQSRTFDADLVVLAAGSEPDGALAAALEGWPGEQVVVGDARAPRSIGAAIAEGRRAGMQL